MPTVSQITQRVSQLHLNFTHLTIQELTMISRTNLANGHYHPLLGINIHIIKIISTSREGIAFLSRLNDSLRVCNLSRISIVIFLEFFLCVLLMDSFVCHMSTEFLA